MQHLRDGWVISTDEKRQVYWKNGAVFGSVEHTGLCWEVLWYANGHQVKHEKVDRDASEHLVKHNVEYRASKRVL